nr:MULTISPECIES: MFS transporter [Arsenicicoccus]
MPCASGGLAAQLPAGHVSVAPRWFPRRERATAIGLVTLANLVGTAIGMVLPTALVDAHGPGVIGPLQLGIGMAALVAGIAYPLLVTDRPAGVPVDLTERELETHGMRHALSVGPFRRYLLAIFIGMGVFKGITQWVADIVAPRGFSATDAGNVGAAMLLGGVIGSVSLSAWSDRLDRRVPFLVAGLALAAPAVVGVALASSLAGLLGAAFLLGFCLVSLMPIGMQYAAEVTWPTPEGTSNGLVQLCGQAAVVYVALLYALRAPDGSYWPGLVLSAVLLLGGALRFARTPESHEHHARATTSSMSPSGTSPSGPSPSSTGPGASLQG